MVNLFFFLCLLSLTFIIVGLISPKKVIYWSAAKNRKNVLLVYGVIFVVSFVAFAIVVPPSPPTEDIAYGVIAQPTPSVEPEENDAVSSVEVETQPPHTDLEVTTALPAQSVTKNVEPTKPEPTKIETASNPDLYLVVRAVDGDTVELEGGERVRYIGIDTPETVDPGKPVQCFGKEASQKNVALVVGKRVRLVKDITDRDRYGRLLRYVYVGETFVNKEMVAQGFAYAYTYPPDVKYASEFAAAQKDAQVNKRGLWGACGTSSESEPASSQTPNFDSGEVSGTQTDPDTQGEGQCVIKGNISEADERIYHLPACKSYTRTKIDVSAGEKWFCSEAEAVKAGWRKAENC